MAGILEQIYPEMSNVNIFIVRFKDTKRLGRKL